LRFRWLFCVPLQLFRATWRSTFLRLPYDRGNESYALHEQNLGQLGGFVIRQYSVNLIFECRKGYAVY
jgi:hypothetical protein